MRALHCFSFKFSVVTGRYYFNNAHIPEAEGQGITRMLSLCLVIQCGVRVSPLGFFLRVIVNEKPLNIEKATSSVLSELLLI